MLSRNHIDQCTDLEIMGSTTPSAGRVYNDGIGVPSGTRHWSKYPLLSLENLLYVAKQPRRVHRISLISDFTCFQLEERREQPWAFVPGLAGPGT